MIDGLRPYPAYADTGHPILGRIPAHWTLQSLASMTTFVRQRNRPDLPLLSVVREKGVVLRSSMSTDENHNYIPDDLSNYKVARQGSLVINKMKAWQGSLGISDYDGIVSPAYYVLAFGIDSPRFGHRLLRSRPYVHFFAQASDGVRIGQWDLSPNDLKRIPVVVPPLPEQLAIVRYLDYMDRRIRRYIRAKRRLIALLNEQKQATIQRAVTRGLDPTVRLKPSGVEWLGDVPEHWEVVPLSATAESIQTGPFGSQLHSGDYVSGGTPVVNPSHLVGGCILPDPRVTADSVTSERLGRHRLREGDIVMPRRGELGRCAAVTRDQEGWLCGTGSIRVRPKASVFAPDYLVQLLSSETMRYALKMYSIGTTMDNLSAGIVARLRLPCPPLEEQNRIVHSTRSVVAAISSTIVLAQRQIDLLREYRTRLIADVVTGKLDIREAAAHLPDEVDEQEPPDEEEVLDRDGDDMDVVDIIEDAEEFVA